MGRACGRDRAWAMGKKQSQPPASTFGISLDYPRMLFSFAVGRDASHRRDDTQRDDHSDIGLPPNDVSLNPVNPRDGSAGIRIIRIDSRQQDDIRKSPEECRWLVAAASTGCGGICHRTTGL